MLVYIRFWTLYSLTPVIRESLLATLFGSRRQPFTGKLDFLHSGRKGRVGMLILYELLVKQLYLKKFVAIQLYILS